MMKNIGKLKYPQLVGRPTKREKMFKQIGLVPIDYWYKSFKKNPIFSNHIASRFRGLVAYRPKNLPNWAEWAVYADCHL